MKEKRKVRDYLLLEIGFVIISISSLFAKMASQQEDFFGFALFLFLELLFLGIYALLWQQTLKRFPLVVAMANKGITIVYSLLWAVFLFHENITITNIIGAAVVICGIIVGSTDD